MNLLNRISCFIILTLILVPLMHATTFTLPSSIGTIKGAFVQYKDANTVSVSIGYGEANGFHWEITSVTDYDVTESPIVDDFIYIYIDDSQSSYPSVTLTDSTTEPSWSSDKQGWYNGNDRCIGAIFWDSSTTAIEEFKSNGNKFFFISTKTLASGLNPNGSYQATTTDADTLTPVFAERLVVGGMIEDIGSQCRFFIRPFELNRHIVGGTGYNEFSVVGLWLETGSADRSVEIQGDDDDDDGSLDCWLYGFEIERG